MSGALAGLRIIEIGALVSASHSAAISSTCPTRGRRKAALRHPVEDERHALRGAIGRASSGQHTDEVLSGLLGLSEAEIAALRDTGALE
jgi:crotonobetainyl-CoA:carnitine CoA-transferase CaiB-like acyl-CoA transferase